MAAKAQKQRRWRLGVAWVISVALLLCYAFLGEEKRDGGSTTGGVVGTDGDKGALQELDKALAADERDELVITRIWPDEIYPGSAVEIRYFNPKPERDQPVQAILGGTLQPKGTVLEVLQARKERIVVRIPKNAALAPAKLRIQLGSDESTKSKPFDFRIRDLDHRELFAKVIGGLAILVFGMRLLSRGTRQYTGNRSQGILARIGRRTPMAVGLGALVGGITQFTTTAAGLVVGLVETHLLAVGPAVAVLLGAQLGAAALPSVLGLAAAHEGLMVVAIGVLWLGFASDRRSEAFGKIILGCGFLFFGLYLLRWGIRPLVADPEIIPYLRHFHADTLVGRMTCLAAGVLLAAVLQGPGPVAVVVLGLAQSSGQLDLPSALTILMGTMLGAAIGTLVVASPFGADARRAARLHLVMAVIGTVLLLASVDLWAHAAEVLVPGAPEKISYGKKIQLPNIGSHLVLGFALSQLAVTALLAALLSPVSKIMQRLFPEGNRRNLVPLSGAAGVAGLRAGLGDVLQLQRRALCAISELCLTGHRARGREGEHILADARNEIEDLFGGAVRSRGGNGEMDRLRQAALATVQLQRALEDLLRHAEKRTEQNMALAPAGERWQISPRDEQTLRALHQLLLEGVDALMRQLETDAPADLDEARAREIRLNAMESESRQGLLADADRGEESHAIALQLNNSELVNAYETVGNHLYRLYETMGGEIDQETPAQAL